MTLVVLWNVASLSPLWGTMCLVGQIGLYMWAAVWLFSAQLTVLEMVAPLAMIVGQFFGVRFWQMFRHLRQAYHSLQERKQQLEQSNELLDQQVRDLSVLNEASRRFAATLNMDILARDVLSVYRHVWAADRGMVVMSEPEGDTFEPLAAHAMEGDQVHLYLFGPGVAAALHQVKTERTVLMGRTTRWFNLFLPLELGPRLWGAVLLHCPGIEEVKLKDQKATYWQTMSGLAATALENSRLYNLATVDALTRLYVRRYFDYQLQQEFKRARRYRHSLALMMTDIDHFKTFNDTHGHQQGDVVLREVAGAVKKSLRDVDLAARYGGEEFALVLPETDYDGAIIVAERVRRNVEELLVPSLNPMENPLRVTISIGVAAIPQVQAKSAEQLVKMADIALYLAKANGRNRVQGAECEPVESEEAPAADG